MFIQEITDKTFMKMGNLNVGVQHKNVKETAPQPSTSTCGCGYGGGVISSCLGARYELAWEPWQVPVSTFRGVYTETRNTRATSLPFSDGGPHCSGNKAALQNQKAPHESGHKRRNKSACRTLSLWEPGTHPIYDDPLALKADEASLPGSPLECARITLRGLSCEQPLRPERQLESF